MKSFLLESVGWLGASAIMLAYALNSFGLLAAGHLPYLLLNLFGSAGIVAVSLKKKAFQPAALNIVWLGIAGIAILRAL